MTIHFNKNYNRAAMLGWLSLAATALHADAAVSCSFNLRYIYDLFFYVFASMPASTEVCIAYDRDALINIGKGSVGFGLSAGDHPRISTSRQAAIQNSRTKHHLKRFDLPIKRGKRGSIRARITKLRPNVGPLPSLHLANVQLQEN